MSHVYVKSLVGVKKLTEALGASFDDVASVTGLDLSLIDNVDATMPADHFFHVYEEVIRRTGDKDMGLLAGRFAYVETFHLYMYLASSSETLKDWINKLPSVPRTLGDLVRIAVSIRGDHLVLELHFAEPRGSGRCPLTDSLLSSTAMLMDGFSLLPARPVRVDFHYQQPLDLAALKDVFRAPLYFEQPVSALYYDKAVLDHAQIHVSTQVYDAVEEEIDSLLADFPGKADAFTADLYALICRLLPSGGCTVDSVARKLNISGRTLQRRLQERNTSFQSFVQDIKFKVAAKHLAEKRLNIIQIAMLLGYSDATSFSAAFKTWHGITPSEFRRRENASRNLQP